MEGPLTTWDPQQTHILKMKSAGYTFTVSGNPLTSVDVDSGWNWIAFASDQPKSSNMVYHTGGFSHNDILKSSNAFVIFRDGSFKGIQFQLQIGKGYLLYCQNNGTVTFSSQTHTNIRNTPSHTTNPFSNAVISDSTATLEVWVFINNEQMLSGYIGAFSENSDVLGSASFADDIKAFLLNIASPLLNESTTVTFKYSDSNSNSIYNLCNSYEYRPNEYKKLNLTNTLQDWKSQINKGDSTTSLYATVSVHGSLVTTGILAAFNSRGDVIGASDFMNANTITRRTCWFRFVTKIIILIKTIYTIMV